MSVVTSSFTSLQTHPCLLHTTIKVSTVEKRKCDLIWTGGGFFWNFIKWRPVESCSGLLVGGWTSQKKPLTTPTDSSCSQSHCFQRSTDIWVSNLARSCSRTLGFNWAALLWRFQQEFLIQQIISFCALKKTEGTQEIWKKAKMSHKKIKIQQSAWEQT